MRWLCWFRPCKMVHRYDYITVDGRIRGVWQCRRCGKLAVGRKWTVERMLHNPSTRRDHGTGRIIPDAPRPTPVYGLGEK